MATHGRHEKPTARTDSAFFEPWSARQGQVPRNDAHLPEYQKVRGQREWKRVHAPQELPAGLECFDAQQRD